MPSLLIFVLISTSSAAIVNHGGNPNFLTGLSSDTKPTNVPPGSQFYATDTGTIYLYTTSSGWIFSVGTTPTDINISITDVTNNNVSTSAHGFAPKGTTGTTQFWRQDWTLTVPPGAIYSGTTGTFGGALLASAGTCTSGTASITGASVGMPVSASPYDGSLPEGGIVVSATVTSSNVVTVQECAIIPVTPAARRYQVRVLQ